MRTEEKELECLLDKYGDYIHALWEAEELVELLEGGAALYDNNSLIRKQLTSARKSAANIAAYKLKLMEMALAAGATENDL
jgi:hypothetical protein